MTAPQITLLKQWNEKNEDRKVTFITPENGEDVYDAWKDSTPGKLTEERNTQESQSTAADGQEM